MTTSERVLTIAFRILGVLICSAFLAVLLPLDWMASIHAWLGLGEMPQSPIVEYLARSTSVLYGFHGILVLVLSVNLRRFKPIVRFVGWMAVACGLILLGVDWHAGMPTYWILWEGPPAALMGVGILLLSRGIPDQPVSS